MFKRGTITDDNKYNKQRKAVTPLADPPIVKTLLPLEIISFPVYKIFKYFTFGLITFLFICN